MRCCLHLVLSVLSVGALVACGAPTALAPESAASDQAARPLEAATALTVTESDDAAGQGVAWHVVAWPTLAAGQPDDIGQLDQGVRVSASVPAPWQLVLRVESAPRTIAAAAIHILPEGAFPGRLSVHGYLGDSPVDRSFYTEFLRLSDDIGSVDLPTEPGWYVLLFDEPRAVHYIWLQTGGSGDPAGTDLAGIRLLTPAQLELLERGQPNAFVTLPLHAAEDNDAPASRVPSPAPLSDDDASPAFDESSP
jgi:hypothetical protein